MGKRNPAIPDGIPVKKSISSRGAPEERGGIFEKEFHFSCNISVFLLKFVSVPCLKFRRSNRASFAATVADGHGDGW